MEDELRAVREGLAELGQKRAALEEKERVLEKAIAQQKQQERQQLPPTSQPRPATTAQGTTDDLGMHPIQQPWYERQAGAVTVASTKLTPAKHQQEIIAAVKALKVGDKFYLSNDYNRDEGGLEVCYERLPPCKAAPHVNTASLQYSSPVSGKTYGTTCPSCSKSLIETGRSTSSDGFMGIESDEWVCQDTLHCGIRRTCYFAGYGNV